jgi:hypothetical protein
VKSLIVVAISSLTFITACSTVPISTPKISGPAIVFVRDTGFVGGGCSFNVFVDGTVVGQVNAGQTVTKLVASGKHRVGIDNASALCPNVKMAKVVAVDGEPVVLRIGITSNFQTIFDQVE